MFQRSKFSRLDSNKWGTADGFSSDIVKGTMCPPQKHTLFYKQQFYKQHQAEMQKIKGTVMQII